MIYSRIIKKYHFILLAAIIFIAILLRAKLIFTSNLLPGINGGYYPLMSEGLISSGSLPFKDAPLVFCLESLLSQFFFLFTNNHDSAIILGCKIVDATWPPLAAIPVYFLAVYKTKKHAFSLLVAGFLILFFPVSYLLTGDLHKNALAIVWLSAFFSSIELFRSHPSTKKLILPGIFLLLLALSHFGALLIGLLALPLLIIPLYSLKKKSLSLNFLILPLLLGSRMDRLSGVFTDPFKLFEHPVLWYLIDGQQILTPFLIAFGISILLLSLLVFINSIITRKGIYWAILALFLSSPLIGIEWYLRLCMMAHIPLIMALICQWEFTGYLIKKICISTLILFTIVSVLLSINGTRKVSISNKELSDLKSIKTEALISENDMIICSHGVEWYTAWFLECNIAQEQAITKSDFDSYDRVLTLTRIENSKGLHRGQTNFANPSTGKDSNVIFEGENLILKQVFADSYSYINPKQDLVSIGQLAKNKKGDWQITNPLYTNPLIFDNIQLSNSLNQQAPNTKYRIYGKRQAFSLNIIVSNIEATSNLTQELIRQ